MTTALFVTAAAPEMGGGHVLRCLALSQALESLGIRPTFAVTRTTIETVGRAPFGATVVLEVEPAEAHAASRSHAPDIVVFDAYSVDRRIEEGWGRKVLKVALDDLANRKHDCDLLVDAGPSRVPADYVALVPGVCEVLTGPAFALLRPAFAQARERALARRSAGDVRRLFVSMGFTDVGGVTRKVVEGALAASKAWKIDVVTGHGAASLGWLREATGGGRVTVHVDADDMQVAELMVEADLAVGAGGGTSLERCCLGLPTLLVVLADNQRAGAEALAHAGAVHLIGELSGITTDRIAAQLASFARQRERLVECSLNAARIVDGNGAGRVARRIVAKLAAGGAR